MVKHGSTKNIKKSLKSVTVKQIKRSGHYTISNISKSRIYP